MRRRGFAIAIMLVLIACLSIAPLAWADGFAAVSTTKANATTDKVSLSAENDAALIDGCSFAVNEFERASKGSNRNIADAYHGYAYYIGSKASTVMYIVTSDSVIVYLDPDAAQKAGFSLSSQDDLANLQSILISLDTGAGGGNALISPDAKWLFTQDKSNEVDGVLYQFAQEIDGSSYNCVIGVDGSDVTQPENAHHVDVSFACFGGLVPAADAQIVAQPSWFESTGQFLSTLDWSPLIVTLKTSLTAIVFIFVLGLAAAYFCLHRSSRVRDIFDTIFTIPMVLPPTVCGFLLLLACGSNTAFGKFFIDIGFPLIFSWQATVIAAVIVAFPLMYRNALGAFDNLDSNMLDAARTLGWSEARIFFKIMLPLSWSSIAAGTVLAFARALGEFGATLFLAGNYLGITRTIPIAIYFEWMNGNTDIAIFWTIVILIFSFIVILFINLWSQHTTRYRKGGVEE